MKNTPFKKKVLIPYMCDGAIPFAAAFRHFGIDAETLAPPNKASFDLGMKLSRGPECSPCFATLGEILTHIKEINLPQEKYCIFFPEGPGPCRFGQYAQLLRLVLKGQGYSKVEILSPSSKDAYAKIQGGASLQLFIWKAVLLSDFLYKSLLATRPYEKKPGVSDKIYWECINKLEKAIENGNKKELKKLPHLLVKEFLQIPKDKNLKKPKVAVVGEIFVRLNEFSNNNLVKILEEYGAEVSVEPLAPWVLYTNWLKKQDAIKEKTIGLYLSAILQDYIQKNMEHHYSHIFFPVTMHHETPIEKIMKYSKEYFPYCLRGEAGIAIGAIIDQIKNGCKGIINILPLNCMPGNNVKGQVPLISQRYPGIPIMNLEIKDGSQETYIRTRVGPFVESARCAMNNFIASRTVKIS